MKDPLDNKDRAYELLGIGRNATLAEVNAAYARLAREQPSRRQELTNAWQRLRRSETRLEEDFWYYVVEQAEPAEPSAARREAFAWDPAVPTLHLGREHTDLAGDRYQRDFTPIEYREVKLTDLPHYDEPVALSVPVVFDK